MSKNTTPIKKNNSLIKLENEKNLIELLNKI